MTALEELVSDCTQLTEDVHRARAVSYQFADAHKRIQWFVDKVQKDVTKRNNSCRMHYEIALGRRRAEDMRCPPWAPPVFGQVMVKSVSFDDE